MKRLTLTTLLLASLPAFAQKATPDNLVQYAHPLVGTAKMGHTYPGATVPFGMVQLSPDTDTISYEQNGKYNPKVYEYCAGYQYADKTIVGFSHTHFSGTGHSDLGDFLVMPTTGPLQLNPGTADQPEKGFRSRFSHQNEVAEPAYYRVKLDDHNILAELTASNRVGMHQYTFPQSEQAHIILDLTAGIYNYPDKNVWTFVRVENDSLITGYRQTNGWARTRVEYFAMAFSKPFASYGSRNYSKRQVYRGFWGRFDQAHNFPELAGEQLRLYFDFKTTANEKIKVKMALSGVSTEGALRNLRAEIPGWDFEAVKRQGQAQWQEQLGKVVIESPKKVDKENFYTAMYHAALSPTTYMDVDGQYRGLDQNIHQAKGFTNYTTFSLWDTYRALHPLFNLLEPQRNADMVQSMLAHYDQSTLHMLPIWSHYANENWCMIGYHSVPVIADAVLKGVVPADQAQRALDACVTTAHQQRYDGIGYYEQLGYVPEDKSGSSVSKTLEYAFDDWCIAQLAKKLGKNDIAAEFSKRAQNWQNVYDSRIGFMRPRLADGSFRQRFDVLSTNDQGFIEGNAWNYSLYVPQDPAGLVAKMGGEKKFVPHLDSLFTMHLPDEFFAETEDITRDGIIGNYVHGNEPAHHAAYLYNWTSQPYKTQARVRMILPKMYRPTPDGLGGNDDCGQMSAWYIFSSLGFYPVAPGSPEYALGSPAVYGATINLENGKTFRIKVKSQSDKNVYVKEARLNGQKLTRPFLAYDDVVKGGELVFTMAGKP
ncbi:glycoside hydrolase family 92 protein [Hymenobacter sp. BT507]|uniref:Glycoside hydrolase family 92 protein n=1 Tax=Hymenobacter citatus TaxID=2763506 RepID=A0ABR7MPX4_9BACT|nr:GH92 family glycosyl hydrolase [Hymenobacter citatus]MBC6612612.1 glycoside hydrolase family 92 protein [Hymenobacter citatus]